MKKHSAIALIGVAALSMGLTACGAGQISQTAQIHAAVDGANADTQDKNVRVRNIVILKDDNGQAALSFTAINREESPAPVTVESVTVAGKPVTITGASEIGVGCSLVASSAADIAAQPSAAPENDCVNYVTTSVDAANFIEGTTQPVEFTFSGAGSASAVAPVSRTDLAAQ
ncbi:MAG: hypothetical protein SPI77_05535 [Corynebacterium sp.]|nr:hypothetical protein [Corynebacterium sp.]